MAFHGAFGKVRMATPHSLPPQHLRQRLRALLIVGSLLGPAFCVFGVLALLSDGWVRWLVLALWLVLGGLLTVIAVRALKTLADLQDAASQDPPG